MWYLTLVSPLTELSAPCSWLVYFGSTIIQKPTLNYDALCGWETARYTLLNAEILLFKILYFKAVNFPGFSRLHYFYYWTISIAFCHLTSTSNINLFVRHQNRLPQW